MKGAEDNDKGRVKPALCLRDNATLARALIIVYTANQMEKSFFTLVAPRGTISKYFPLTNLGRIRYTKAHFKNLVEDKSSIFEIQ